jgi:hypothetical protein
MADAEGASARGRRWFRATTLPGNVRFDGCQRAPVCDHIAGDIDDVKIETS